VFHLCKNHAFADGNKRAALAALVSFLAINHRRLEAHNEQAAAVILRLAAGDIDKPTLTERVAANGRALSR